MSEIIGNDNTAYIGNEDIIKQFKSRLETSSNYIGDIFLINGYKGIGKTRLLKEFQKISENKKITSVFIQAPRPNGNIALTDLQPFAIFGQIIHEMQKGKNSAKIQLAQNIGMTLLASLPIAGDVFYGAKEINKDLKEYKKSNSINLTEKNFIDVFKKTSKKEKLVILIDDFHFADNMSFGLMKSIISEISQSSEMNILFALSVDNHSAIRQIYSLKELEKSIKVKKANNFFELTAFSDESVVKAIQNIFPGKSISNDVKNWFINKSHRNPQALYQYLEFVKKGNYDFDKLSSEDNTMNVPTELHNLMMMNLISLNEFERNFLANCAMIGFEFPVTIAAKLLSLDVLTTIRHLHSIQNRTGIVHSIGVKTTFGEKVTHYHFSQPIYKEQFVEQLEYEEKKEIHIIVTNLLKALYEKTTDINVKNSIMPLLISHATNSEDQALFDEVMRNHLEIAKGLDDTISQQAIQNFYKTLQERDDAEKPEAETISVTQTHTEEMDTIFKDIALQDISNDEFETTRNLMDYASKSESNLSFYGITFEQLVEFSLNPVSDDTIQKIEYFIEKTTNKNEKLKANLLLAKILTATEKYEKASDLLKSLNFYVNAENPSFMDILYLNTQAVLNYRNGEFEKAINLLKKASRFSLKMTSESKLLTLSNIALILKTTDLTESIKHKIQVEKKAKEMNYTSFLEDFQRNYELIN